jgi:hypothetical protein
MDKYTLRKDVKNLDVDCGARASRGILPPEKISLVYFATEANQNKRYLRELHKNFACCCAPRALLSSAIVQCGYDESLHFSIAKLNFKHYYWSNQWTNKSVLHKT